MTGASTTGRRNRRSPLEIAKEIAELTKELEESLKFNNHDPIFHDAHEVEDEDDVDYVGRLVLIEKGEYCGRTCRVISKRGQSYWNLRDVHTKKNYYCMDSKFKVLA